MSNIRVTYSGLIAFFVGLASVFTGLIFTIIVTRRLSPEEFGTWSLIGALISYFLISQVIISYWSIRQIARGDEVGRTSVISSTLFSFGALPFYIILSSIIANESNAHFESMLLGTILIPLYFVSQSLNAVNLGHKPQATSYGLIIFESAKIPAALAFVLILNLDLNGAIIAVALAFVAKIIVQIHFAKPKIKEKFNFGILKRWMKLSWVSLYSIIPQFIRTLDISLYALITSSVIGVAYFGASMAVASMITHAGMISQALYPKLLANGNRAHVFENFTLLMYFGIPLLGLAVIFSKPALFALNPLYQEASMIVILLSFRTFFFVLSQTLQRVMMGIEKVDVEKNPSYSRLAKSKLFLVSTINYIQSGLYIGLFIGILIFLNMSKLSELELVTAWSYIALFVEIPFFILIWIIVQKNVKFSFPYLNTAKYVGSTIFFIIVYILTSELIIKYEISIYDFLPGLIIQFSICVGLYLLITFLIDKRTRNLFSSIIHEIIQK